MHRRRIMLLPLAAPLVGQTARGSDDQAAEPPVRRVDHIMIRTDQPAQLYAFWNEVLQLPVAWPLATRGPVTSGGVGVGNVNVEAIQFPRQPPSLARLVGFGFEPSPLPQCLRELARRGIRHGEPRPFVSTMPDGSKRTLFTNVTLQELSDADRPATATIHIFLSEYSPDYVDVEQRRARLRRAVRESGGGPLGITGIREVVVGATDTTKATAIWQRLVEPTRPSAPGLWRVGDGPSIRVVRADEDRLQALIVSVLSLPRARDFLQEKGLLGSVTDAEVRIDPSKIWDLDLRLVEDR